VEKRERGGEKVDGTGEKEGECLREREREKGIENWEKGRESKR